MDDKVRAKLNTSPRQPQVPVTALEIRGVAVGDGRGRAKRATTA